MIKRIRNNFMAGIVVLMPLMLTLLIFAFLFEKINTFLLNPFVQLLQRYVGQRELELIWVAKLCIFIFVILMIASIGFLARNIFARRIFGLFEQLLIRLPFVDKIYTSIKEIRDAFFGRSHNFFEKAVLIEYPRKGMYSIGFVTTKISGELKEKLKKENLLAIFISTVPNPTSGMIIFLPEEEVIPLEMSVEEGLKLVISAGMTARSN